MGYTDIHCHLLPGIDDGAADLEESVGMLTAARAAGSSAIVATPHMFQHGLGSEDPDEVRRRFESFLEALEAFRDEHDGAPAVDLHMGAENFVGAELLQAVTDGSALTLAGSRFLLVEFWPLTAAGAARQALDVILQTGVVPVLAHVERYRFLQDDPDLLEALVGSGCIAQSNAGAVLGDQGLRATELTDRWLRRGLVHVIASDGHGLGRRRPELAAVAEHLERRYGSEMAHCCIESNPQAIVQDATPEPPPVEPRRRWWRR